MYELFFVEMKHNLTWKEYLQLYPDCRICTVSSIPVYRSCRRTRLSLNLRGSFKKEEHTKASQLKCSLQGHPKKDLHEWFEQVLLIIMGLVHKVFRFLFSCIVSRFFLPTFTDICHTQIPQYFSDQTILPCFFYTNVNSDQNQSRVVKIC